ncbi:hypothetical protein T4E_7091 [Trichinella pseudospiralis]|uniref:Uncharacterized protein n=1 Tax=Trichinella pseudospiralis TaxID=6337 RepID=A0A0V0Y1D2_TRIPS|nr:hypothetical protein T4E_7091 [Trichinella pseudospiralis]
MVENWILIKVCKEQKPEGRSVGQAWHTPKAAVVVVDTILDGPTSHCQAALFGRGKKFFFFN